MCSKLLGPLEKGTLPDFLRDQKYFVGTQDLNFSHCVGCIVVLHENKNNFFLQVRMMDVEKCGTRDMNSKQQNGKNFSRDWKLKKGNKKLKNKGKAIIIISPYFTEC